MTTVDAIREQIQDMAYQAWENTGRKGTIVMATGVGKSKLAIRRVQELASGIRILEPQSLVLLVTPTERLRDENWPSEFEKWVATVEMNKAVRRICFASLKNERGNHYNLVILDEIHRLTELSAKGFMEVSQTGLIQFFAQNLADEVMGLTATEPDPQRDILKANIIRDIAPVCFRYSLDEAVRDGVVPEYEIMVIMTPLEAVVKTVSTGPAAKPFMTTETTHYDYLNKLVIKSQIAARSSAKSAKWAQMCAMKRNRFIYTLKSKTDVAARLITKVTEGKRTLVFCGGIEQSRILCGKNVYNSSPEDKKRGMLDKFKDEEIDILGVVDAVNEGHNIPMMDQQIIVAFNSNERNMVQRIGRSLRHRPGYKAKIWLIVAQGTVDEQWMRKALEDFDQSRITYDTYMNYR